MGIKQEILHFIESIKDTKNAIPFDSKSLKVPVNDFVKIMTQEFGIVIYKKSSKFYLDPETAVEYGLDSPPLFGSEIHNISKWVCSLSQNHNNRVLKQDIRDALLKCNECPEFIDYDNGRVKKVDKKLHRQLCGMMGIYNNVSEIYKYGSKEDIRRYELDKLNGKRISFPFT